MRRHRAVIVSASLVLLGLVAGCSSSSGSTSGTTSTTVRTPTSKAAPTTATAVKATGGAPTSAQAAAELVAAWEHHDKAAAAQIADPMAVMGIFGTPDPSMWIRGCTTDDSLPQGGCVYRTETGLVQINTEHRPQGWVVTSASFDAQSDGNATSGNAPDGPPPTTAPPPTTVTPLK